MNPVVEPAFESLEAALLCRKWPRGNPSTFCVFSALLQDEGNFSDFDKIDDAELNEILWHAVKGKDVPLPPTVRRAIVERR